jgi:hypothetical protein
MSNEKLFAETLLQGAHSLEALIAEFGPGPGEDGEVNLATVDRANLHELEGSKVLPIPGVKRYLESGDALTDFAIDQMEIAMEKAYQIEHPFFIASHRQGKEGKNLAVSHFYLSRE